MPDQITVYECSRCHCRGPEPDTIRHLVTCPARDDPDPEVIPLTFTLGSDDDKGPLFGP